MYREAFVSRTPEIQLVLCFEAFSFLEHGFIELVVEKVVPCQGEIQKTLFSSHGWEGQVFQDQ